MKANQVNLDSVPNHPQASDENTNTSSYFEQRAAVGIEMEKQFTLGQLFKSIFGRLHPLFSIDCGALIIYDDSMQHITRAYISEKSADITNCIETISDPVSLSLITKEICDFAFPVLKSREDWIDDFGENHCLPNHSSDFNFHCYIPLENDGKVLGTFELHNHNRELSSEGLAFCCNIADLFSSLLSSLDVRFKEREIPITAEQEAVFLEPSWGQALGHLLESISSIGTSTDLQRIVESFLVDTIRADYAELFLGPEKVLFPSKGENHSLRFHAAVDDLDIAESYVELWEKFKVRELISLTLTEKDQTFGQIIIGSAISLSRKDPSIKLLQAAGEIIKLKILDLQSREKILNQQNEISQVKERLSEFLVEDMGKDSEQLSSPSGIVGTSAAMEQVFKLLDRISSSETTVLILGETGTGKELIAKAIHEGSPRKKKTMIKVNCAAIPPNLIESELFGHEKGSFTGATERRIGKFEQAHQSTIFLDEVGELPLDLQVRLLRVLQEKEIERVGGKVIIPTDVRIISATNRDLLQEVEAGKFRQDLFYRLNVFPISLPPLRERANDIPVLAMHFLERFVKRSNREVLGFSKKAIATLKAYSWPGNVRELEHVIERQVVLCQGPVIKDIDLQSSSKTSVSPALASVKTIFENERDHIFSVLELCNGKISGESGAAKLLGVPATTLNSKIKRLGLAKKHIF